jgi:DNA repair ATPase RecN
MTASRYYQDACVLSTLDAEFWQREYQSLYQEYRQCDSKLEKMNRWCKELEDRVEMLEN